MFSEATFLTLGSGIVQWYSAGLQAAWSEVRVPAGAGNFFLHHRVQTGSGSHTASSPKGTRGCFPGSKVTGLWSWPLTSIQCWCKIWGFKVMTIPHHCTASQPRRPRLEAISIICSWIFGRKQISSRFVHCVEPPFERTVLYIHIYMAWVCRRCFCY
jgi:hypothetical protein